jgi:DUF1680 family protein
MTRRQAILGAATAAAARAAATGAVRAVAFPRVEVAGPFWEPWMALTRSAVLPHNLRMMRQTGVLENFEKAAGMRPGGFSGFENIDEVLYKTVEGASHLLARKPDPSLDRELDAVIRTIAAAQQPNGYLCTPHTIRAHNGVPDASFGGPHLVFELYLFGHLRNPLPRHRQTHAARCRATQCRPGGSDAWSQQSRGRLQPP